MLPVIYLEPAFYKGQEVILLRYANSQTLEQHIKSIKGVKWHLLRSGWYLPLHKESYSQLKEKIGKNATIDISKLKNT